LRLVSSSSSFNDAPLFISFANFGHEEEKGKIILLSKREKERREIYSHINSNVDSTRGSGV
jgi:putative lipase involved disintegration of autophagic bodies